MTYLTISEARENLRRATKTILDLEGDYGRASERSADAEGVYRHELAEAFKRYREAGDAVEASSIKARGECAVLKREAIAAAGAFKLAAEKLEDARDSRRSLWRLIEWSREHDRSSSSNGTPENVPKERWP